MEENSEFVFFGQRFWFIVALTLLFSFVTIGLVIQNFYSTLSLSPRLSGGVSIKPSVNYRGVGFGSTAVPLAPQNVAASVGQEQITISWDNVVGATGYNIYRNLNSNLVSDCDLGSPSCERIGSVAANDLDFVDIGLFKGETAWYAVRAFNSNGESAWGNVDQGQVNQNFGMQWSYPSDGGWIAEFATFGSNGEEVFTQHGSWFNYKVLFDSVGFGYPNILFSIQNSPLAVLKSLFVGASSQSSTYASLTFNRIGSSNLYEITLQKFSPTSQLPDWEITHQTFLIGDDDMGVAVSDDGTQIFHWWYNPQTFGYDYFVRDAVDSSLISQGFLGTNTFNFGTIVSGDLSTVLFYPKTTPKPLYIVDEASEAILYQEWFFSGGPKPHSVDLSSEGSRMAYGWAYYTNAEYGIRVFDRQGQSYTQTSDLSFSSAFVPSTMRTLDLSPDGTRVVAGYDDFTTNVGVIAYDLANGNQETMQHEYQSPEGDNHLFDLVQEVSLSDDGTRFVAGYWGDEFHETSEIKVFSAVQDDPLFEFYTVGSINDIEISPDGSLVAAAIIGGHAQDPSQEYDLINLYDVLV